MAWSDSVLPEVKRAAEEVVRQSPKFQRESERVAKVMLRAAKGALHSSSPRPSAPEGTGQSPPTGFDSYVDSHVVANIARIKHLRRRRRKRKRKKISEGLVQMLSRQRAAGGED